MKKLMLILFFIGCINLVCHSNEKDIEVEDCGNSVIDYSSYLKKVWIVDRTEEKRKYGEAFDFVITEIANSKITGYLKIGGGVENCYFDGLYNEDNLYNPFHGTIYNDTAECIFKYKNVLVNFDFLFVENDRIEATMKCESLGMNESYYFRPYNLLDEQLHDDISSKELFLESWGKVNLVAGTTDSRHSIPWVAITNEQNDILYEFDCSGGISGSIIWDIFVDDVNSDGLQDIWTVTCFDNEPDGCRFVCVFYQLENGLFRKEERITVDVPGKYFGDYCIVEFCPTSGYSGNSEERITEQDVEQMIGCTVTIKEDWLVTYDSERRLGNIRHGKTSQGSDSILEFRYEKVGYGWESVSSEAMGYELMADDNLREAIGEEYYEKINGVIYNTSFQVQRFYTLEDENKIIMHSLLTGQYFILERMT
ncbi:MAG: hypothetical protein IJN54_06155 [Lachnospiraceae bacterium]|nr:hypothetical protein [Lachnospiraceae bacterium]